MKLHVLGCGDAFGSGGRNQSAYLLDAGGRMILLDCGATTLPRMKRSGFDPVALDAVLLSHLHGDHFGGLPFLLIEYLYQSARALPLIVAGPPGTEECVRKLFRVMYGGSDGSIEKLPIEFLTLQPDERRIIAGVEVFAFPVPHQRDRVSLALKVSQADKQLLFSGDSAWTEAFVEHSAGVDLFLCECSFYDSQPARHLDYQTLRRNLPRLRCKRLILTHLGDDMLARRRELEVDTAQDGMEIEI